MQPYSAKFKDRMVQRMLGPDSMSASALAKEVGVSQSALSHWLKQAIAAPVNDMKQPRDSAPPPTATNKTDPWEKARLVLRAEGLAGEELGAFLRQHGLHESDLQAWRQSLMGAFDSAAQQRDRREDRKRIQELERELRRKDKALAETAALLVLKKKAQALWGDEDDDTGETSGNKS
jgi:transposase